MGNVFDVPGSTFSPEEWMEKKCVIELESLGPDAANFLTLLLLTILRELLRQNPKAPKDKPRHVIFLEEAHNLIGPTTVANSENGDAKVASTKYIVDMLAEVRALREAIVIADQLPTGLAPQVTKNTSLKIGHRITAMDDRELLASTMSADGVQLEKMATFQPGHALCVYENIQKPFEVQICEYGDNSEPPDNEELFELLASRQEYQTVMERDYHVMMQKFSMKFDKVAGKFEQVMQGDNVITDNKKKLSQMTDIDDETYKKLYISLRAMEEQQARRIDQLMTDWLEYLLELSEYVRMNRLHWTEGIRKVKSEIGDFLGYAKGMLLDDPVTGHEQSMAESYKKIIARLRTGISWMPA